MKNVFSLLPALVLLCTLAPHTMAAGPSYPTKTFDAKYSISNAQGGSSMRLASDGKGHLKTETSAAGYKSVTIVDYPGKKQTTLIEQGKIAMQTKLPDGSGYVADDSAVKAQGGKAIGNKLVNGHPCHGFQYTTPGGKSEVWIADDVGILAQSTTNTPAGKIVMDLKSVSTGAPAADEFKVPSGYKLTSQ